MEEQRDVGSRIPEVVDLRAASDELFASPTLVDLLMTFCADPERSFYVNELIRRSGRFPRSVQLALAKLERARLVHSERQANMRYYRIVTAHPLYPDVHSLCSKVLDVGRTLRLGLSRIPSVRVAFLRPEDPESPDLDLIVVDDGDRAEVEAAVAASTARLSRRIRIEHLTTGEWLRQSRRQRSFVRWLLEEERTYVVGGDADLPRG